MTNKTFALFALAIMIVPVGLAKHHNGYAPSSLKADPQGIVSNDNAAAHSAAARKG